MWLSAFRAGEKSTSRNTNWDRWRCSMWKRMVCRCGLDLAAACLMALAILPAVSAQTSKTFPLGNWPRATPSETGLDAARLARARDYALTGGGSGIVIHHGKLVYAWGDLKARYDLKSS